ncbi:MAG TPA: hypothetical protein VGI74_13700 [Streptosporangiaceae bacterium]
MLSHASGKSRGRIAVAVAGVTVAAGLTLSGTGGKAQAAGPVHPAAAQSGGPGTISTVAGGVGGPGPGRQVAINFPCGVNVSAGAVYIGDGLVQELKPGTDWLTTQAGGVRRAAVIPGEPVDLGNDGPAADAVTSACGVALDKSGNLVIADQLNGSVRVVAAHSGSFYGMQMTAGHIYTIAGVGRIGRTDGNGGPATKAVLSQPADVAVDSSGNVVLTDSGNPNTGIPAQVQVVAATTGNFYGQHMTAGDIYNVAGNGHILKASGDGGPAVKAGLGATIGQVRIDSDGNLVLADTSGNSIRVVPVKSGTFYGQQMTAEHIYPVAGTGTAGFSGDGGPATQAKLNGPLGVTADSGGNLLIADSSNDRVRLVAAKAGTFHGQQVAAGDIDTIAGCEPGCAVGDGGPALKARVTMPDAVAVDASGDVIVDERGEGRVSDDRRVRAIAASSGHLYGQNMTAGDIYTIAGNGTLGLSGNGGPALRAVMITSSSRMAVDSDGNVVVAAGENNRLRVVPASSGRFYGVQMTAGRIYTVAGGGCFPYCGDGGLATHAGMNFPDGLAIDADGNLAVADEGNNRVRVVADTTGNFYGQHMTADHIYTVAGDGKQGSSGDGGPATKAELSVVSGLAVDRDRNLIITDDGSNRIRVLAATTGNFYGQHMTADDIYTIAGDGTSGFSGDGGLGTNAELAAPKDVASDGDGNVIIVDQGNSRIRVLAGSTGNFYGVAMTTGHIYSIAGNGSKGFSGDGGPATGAEFDFPAAVALDSHGNVIIADQNNNRVRVIAEADGTFYGVPMTTGNIYSVAGDGLAGYSGDGGPATKADLLEPAGVAVNGAGALFVADNYRVRKITG